MATKVINDKEVKALGWDFYTNSATKGLSAAIKTSQGIAFGFTSNHLYTMCDDDGFFTAGEMNATIKAYGNYTDFEMSRIIATVSSADGDIADIEDVKTAIIAFGTAGNVTDAAKAKLTAADWSIIASELEPFIKGVQSLSVLVNAKI